jgi:glucosyl-3-phosphoglycerate synthase
VITFAVIGHNEAAYLPTSLGQALEAAGDGDRVVFVDSGSSDDSVEIAGSLGVDVVRAPVGKGRAVAAALEHSHGDAICLVDADIEASENNIPAALAERYSEGDAGMVVAAFDWRERGPLVMTRAVYQPLLEAMFPDAARTLGRVALSGFRIFDTSVPLGRLPAGYGVESHINVAFVAAGEHVAKIHVGRYWGPLRDKRDIGAVLAETVLDLAVEHGRLEPACRPGWERWVEEIATVGQRRDPHGMLGEADWTRLQAILDGPRPPVATPVRSPTQGAI